MNDFKIKIKLEIAVSENFEISLKLNKQVILISRDDALLSESLYLTSFSSINSDYSLIPSPPNYSSNLPID